MGFGKVNVLFDSYIIMFNNSLMKVGSIYYIVFMVIKD